MGTAGSSVNGGARLGCEERLPAAPRLGLPRALRLERPHEFEQARRQGRRLVKGCLIVNWLARPAGSGPKLGVVTSRKIGPAVVRNRARRLMREAFRQHQHELRAAVTLVLVARQSIAEHSLAQVENDLLAALRQARLVV